MPIECLKCAHTTLDESALSCPQCGAIYSKVRALAAEGKFIRTIKSPEQIQQELEAREFARQQALVEFIASARRTNDWSGVPREIVEAERQKIILTTTEEIPRHEIDRVVGIVTAECVYGMNIFKDILADVRDIIGGRSGAAQTVLRDARATALNELRSSAFELGASAVVAIRFEYGDISGGNRMLFVSATGTAVVLAAA